MSMHIYLLILHQFIAIKNPYAWVYSMQQEMLAKHIAFRCIVSGSYASGPVCAVLVKTIH